LIPLPFRSYAPTIEKPNALGVIFRAGLLCGVLDITAAFVTWAPKGVPPEMLLQAIASGLLGEKSFDGRWETAALGAALHFLIAFSAAAVFYAASRTLTFMTSRPVLAGICYGVAVYLFMYWIVMPLSNLRRRPFSASAALIAILTHMVCVGLPISLVVRRYSR
jgi:uncharacterized membrane protein YagU involved in acid resistance